MGISAVPVSKNTVQLLSHLVLTHHDTLPNTFFLRNPPFSVLDPPQRQIFNLHFFQKILKFIAKTLNGVLF